MQKIIDFIISDGLKGTVKYVFENLRKYGFYQTHTFIWSLNELEFQPLIYNDDTEVKFEKVEGLSNWLSLPFNRFKYLKLDEWHKNGASLIVVRIKDIPEAYVWLQRNTYKIDGIETINNPSKQVFIGPVFVSDNCRGKGVSKLIMSEGIRAAFSEGVSEVVGSTSYKNIPSIKMVARLGFKPVCFLTNNYVLGKLKSVDEIFSIKRP